MALVNLKGHGATRAQSVTLGAGRSALIVPITGANASQIASRARAIERSAADIVEWRVDGLGSLDTAIIQGALQVLRRETSRPILATYRTRVQGGEGNPTDSLRVAKVVLEAGVDALDIEETDPNADEIAALVYEGGAVPVLSVHDFERTPGVEALIKKLTEMQARVESWFERAQQDAGKLDALNRASDSSKELAERGPGVIKIACMANEPMDALKVAVAVRRFADAYQQLPAIALAMGEDGELTRAFAGAIGSAATFTMLAGESSAPGQIDIEALANFARETSALKLAGRAGEV
ncbi:MAG: type I 3-dehydroquinate dehydratase [Actinomycetaceae bacterium]|nr:type I 3-dehydroquinate dehydratase [Actinomycetaceae bacterium]